MFYAMPKVHKTPYTTRPVVSCVNSFNAILSTWLDFRMKQLIPFVPSYLPNSDALLAALKALPNLPENAKIFTADAISMYTNIDSHTGINAFEQWFSLYSHEIPADFPCQLFLQVLTFVMNQNIFQFDDTFWLQTQGTAMGTPAACMYATIAYGFHERTKILPKFANNNLVLYRRYIDDIFGIWIPSSRNNTQQWEFFKNTLNEFGHLRWKVENPSSQVNFLDLTLSVQHGQILSSTYHKPMNLYLYLPPLSAHPIGGLKGLIVGNILRYWKQNSRKDFIRYTADFIHRLEH